VSGDFREHPIAYLMAGLYEHHDKSRFEVTAMSFSPDQDTDTTRRLKAAFEHFIDVRAKSDQEVAALVREREIDIAIDLAGFLEGARPDIFARRAAPVQVNYLGYPGTMGANYIDYIVGDPIVIPQQDFRFYTEKVVWLPDTYLATDGARSIANSTPARRDLELPEDGFVFCCFNYVYKINPAMFEIWMRLLRQVEGSVLWLREHRAVAADNLRSEAQLRGVAPERLIFAPRAPLAADHLARQRQADLYLDTLPYNAHTTATEAIWAGLPVLACTGSSFAGRVAASVNSAVGMPELVTNSLPEYEALALKIATDPALCARLKDKLARNRQSSPLFDTARFTRHIEAAYERMWQTCRQGRPPTAFAVERDDQIRDF
jgi:protein O-GlcNAc transferase